MKWEILYKYISSFWFIYHFSNFQFIHWSIALNIRYISWIKYHLLSWWFFIYFFFWYKFIFIFSSIQSSFIFIWIVKSYWKEFQWLYYHSSWIWVQFQYDGNYFLFQQKIIRDQHRQFSLIIFINIILYSSKNLWFSVSLLSSYFSWIFIFTQSFFSFQLLQSLQLKS